MVGDASLRTSLSSRPTFMTVIAGRLQQECRHDAAMTLSLNATRNDAIKPVFIG